MCEICKPIHELPAVFSHECSTLWSNVIHNVNDMGIDKKYLAKLYNQKNDKYIH